MSLLLLAGKVEMDDSSPSLHFYEILSGWPEDRASRATGMGCFHNDPYYIVSNESERKRTLMSETGHLDF